MRVPKYNFPLEKHYYRKLELIAKRVTRKSPKSDAVMIFEGAEGEGKTTYAVGSAFVLADLTGREFNEKNVFFDVNKLREVAQSTKEQILIWDEPALQALRRDWRSEVVANFERLLMMARKKRHIIMICMTKFFKFSEYIVVDRAICLVHVYSRNQVEAGRFFYVKKKKLEWLWNDYMKRRQRSYMKHSCKVTRGTFPDVMNPDYEYNILKYFDIDYYEKMKDEAIESIGKDDKKEVKNKLDKVKQNILLNDKVTNKEKAEMFGVTLRTIHNWLEKLRQETDYVGIIKLKE